MTIIRPSEMPRLWWLCPWSYARTLHRAANALRALCDRQDDLLRGRYTTRPRYSILTHAKDGVPMYYFQDNDCPHDRLAGETRVKHGITLLYDGPTKSYVFEYDAAKAIERLTALNR